MRKEFLERLYWTASAELSNPCAGDRLTELYERIRETQTARDAVDARLEALGVELDRVNDDLAVLSEAFERQGFFNGFRLGVMLWNELNHSAGHGNDDLLHVG